MHNTKKLRRAVGVTGAFSAGLALVAAPAPTGATPTASPASLSADPAVLAGSDHASADLEIVGPKTALSASAVAAGDITDTFEGQLRIRALVDRGEFSNGRAPGTALRHRLGEQLSAHAFGSGSQRQVIVHDGGEVVARRGANAAGETVYELGVSAGADTTPGVSAGSSLQGPPGNSIWNYHASGGYNTTVGNHFDRRVDWEVWKVNNWSEQTGSNCDQNASHCRDWWRTFETAAGGPLTGGSGKKMERMWVETDPKPGWPSSTSEKGAPEPQTSVSTTGTQCTTTGWGTSVGAQLPPVNFGVTMNYSNQVCRPFDIERIDPVNRAETGRHGSQFKHFNGGISGSRAVATSTTVHYQAKNGSQPGWYFYSGQSEDL